MVCLKFKLCRRLGENIWHSKKLTPRQNITIKLVLKKNTNRKQSDFSKKLQQLKKLAYFYEMRSLSNLIASNNQSNLDKKKSLLLNLETRLDVLLVRLYFCPTLLMARQLITHNKIRVNFCVVNIPGFTVRNGDMISFVPSQIEIMKSDIISPLRIQQRNVWLRQEISNVLDKQDLRPSRLRYSRIEVSPFSSSLRVENQKQTKLLWNSYHLEVNYKTFHAILLYEPVQIHFPYKIDLDILF